ncbi:MAG: glycosyl hydrolase [Pseudomonadota bacterium]
MNRHTLNIITGLPCWLVLALAPQGCGEVAEDPLTPPSREEASAPSPTSHQLIIGQDLDAIRGYLASDCCPAPDGLTAYLDLYNLLAPGTFGGLGMDGEGRPLDFEHTWGAGPVSAYTTATAFGVRDIAIGLSITENDHPGELQRLAEGAHDDKIEQLARFAEVVQGKVYLRIGYEFDGAWNQGYENPERFIAAYRRIVDVLRAAGTDNIEYVLQASAAGVDEIIDGGHEDISRWYPGDDYVDWLGLSWFMNPHERSIAPTDGFVPLSPGALADEVIALARVHGKPVMIAEASPQAFDINEGFTAHHSPIWDGEAATERVTVSSTEIWDYWFAPLFAYLDEHHDVIRALAYINVDWDSQPMWGPPYASGFWGDTRLETNPELAERFTRAVAAWKGGE